MSGNTLSRHDSGELDHTSYIFEMEQIVMRDNTVITMGKETIVPTNGPDAGKTHRAILQHKTNHSLNIPVKSRNVSREEKIRIYAINI